MPPAVEELGYLGLCGGWVLAEDWECVVGRRLKRRCSSRSEEEQEVGMYIENGEMRAVSGKREQRNRRRNIYIL